MWPDESIEHNSEGLVFVHGPQQAWLLDRIEASRTSRWLACFMRRHYISLSFPMTIDIDDGIRLGTNSVGVHCEDLCNSENTLLAQSSSQI